MNAKTWAPLVVAIALGGAAAKVGKDFLANRTAPAKTVVVNVARVVVLKEDVAAGTALKAAMLGTSNVPEGTVPPGSFNDTARLLNRVVTMPVLKGQPVLENMLAPEGSAKGLTAMVPDGMRAVSLEINEVSGVGGLLVPGCRVDVVVTISGDNGQQVTRTVARNLQVIAIGRRLSDGSKDKEKDDAAADAGPPARNVTLLVTPREAELVDLAAHNGQPRLVLRGSRDSNKDLAGDAGSVTIGELRNGPGGATSGKSEGGGWMRNALSGLIDPVSKAMADAREQQARAEAAGSLFTRPAEAPAATQPAAAGEAEKPQFRQVTVIRSTKEQAVSVEVSKEGKRVRVGPDFANTDTGEAIKAPGGSSE
jgi:pilus assembly protein CpaB